MYRFVFRHLDRIDATDEGENISKNLKELHAPAAGQCGPDEKPEILYHMTTLKEWEQAAGGVYFPRTFDQDGCFTHATGVPSRLVETANHFYTDVEGDWICLQFSRSKLLTECGIVVRDEEALPVGSKQVNAEWVEKNWVCPHVMGGIPVKVVEKVWEMQREGNKFVGIQGLC